MSIVEPQSVAEPRAAAAGASRLWRRWLVVALSALVTIMVVGLLAVGWVGSERAIHPVPDKPDHTLAEYSFQVEEVRFPSRDGTPLNAWFVKGSRLETIIVVHGFRASKQDMLDRVDMLHRAGFGVFDIDLRSSSQSGGAATTFGYFERLDVAAAADYLLTRPDVDRGRIGAYGVSMGAASVLMGAPDSDAIRALVVEGPYASIDSVAEVGFEHFLHLPAFPFAPITVKLSELRAGIEAARIRPINDVARLGLRPVLFIVGLDSTEIRVQDSIDMFKAARGPRQLWLIPGGKHADGLEAAPREYPARVAAFFEAALNGKPLPTLAFSAEAS